MSLSEDEDAVILRLARSFARKRTYSRSIDVDDYHQAGRIAVLRERLDGSNLDVRYVMVAAHHAMVHLTRTAARHQRGYDRMRDDPLRRKAVSPVDHGLSEDLRRALETLTPLEWRIVVATYWLGATGLELAASIGLHKDTISGVLVKARKKLKAAIGDGYGEFARKVARRYKSTVYNGRPRYGPKVDRRAYWKARRDRLKLERENQADGN